MSPCAAARGKKKQMPRTIAGNVLCARPARPVANLEIAAGLCRHWKDSGNEARYCVEGLDLIHLSSPLFAPECRLPRLGELFDLPPDFAPDGCSQCRPYASLKSTDNTCKDMIFRSAEPINRRVPLLRARFVKFNIGMNFVKNSEIVDLV